MIDGAKQTDCLEWREILKHTARFLTDLVLHSLSFLLILGASDDRSDHSPYFLLILHQIANESNLQERIPRSTEEEPSTQNTYPDEPVGERERLIGLVLCFHEPYVRPEVSQRGLGCVMLHLIAGKLIDRSLIPLRSDKRSSCRAFQTARRDVQTRTMRLHRS